MNFWQSAWRHRMLTFTLARRQFQLRYRQSLVGVAWAVIPTLGTLAVSNLVFHRVAGVDTGQTPYVIVTMAALIPWSFFASCLTTGVTSVVAAQPLVTRLSFPRVTIPLSQIGTALIDLAITTGIFVLLVYLTDRTLPVTAFWYPALLGIEVVLVVGIVLLGAALNVFMRDMKLLVPIATQLWLLVTPVMYPLDAVPASLQPLYLLNPMTGVVESFRDVLVNGIPPSAELLAPAMVGAAVFFLLGSWYFNATEPRFADVI